MARRREVPEPWKTFMAQKGISSIRQLSQQSGVSAPAISRLMHKESRQEDDTIVRIADTLGLDLAKAYDLAGVTAPEAKPYAPPAEAHRLNDRQRKAIDELIRATVADLQDERAGDGSEHSATPMSQAEGNSAEKQLAANFVADKKQKRSKLRPVPDMDTVAADTTGETEKERQNREAAKRGEGDQSDPYDA